MIIRPQIVRLRVTCNNVERYLDLGYSIMGNPLAGGYFEVSVDDLTSGAREEVHVICDYCLGKRVMPYYAYYQAVVKGTVQKVACDECSHLKQGDACEKTWGVRSPSVLEEVQEKARQTNLARRGVPYPVLSPEVDAKRRQTLIEKYGTDQLMSVPSCRLKYEQTNLQRYGASNPMKNPEVREKASQSVFRRFGVRNPMQSRAVRAKAQATWRRNLGVDNPAKSPAVQAKTRRTVQRRFGVDHVFQSRVFRVKAHATNTIRWGDANPMRHPAVRQKARETMFRDGTVQASLPQRYLALLLGAELNSPCEGLSLDLAWPGVLRYSEYNGSGHSLQVMLNQISADEQVRKETTRYYKLKRIGWKPIFVIGRQDDRLPEEEVIKDLFREALIILGDERFNWCLIDLNRSVFETKHTNPIPIELGRLRKITQSDVAQMEAKLKA